MQNSSVPGCAKGTFVQSVSWGLFWVSQGQGREGIRSETPHISVGLVPCWETLGVWDSWVQSCPASAVSSEAVLINKLIKWDLLLWTSWWETGAPLICAMFCGPSVSAADLKGECTWTCVVYICCSCFKQLLVVAQFNQFNGNRSSDWNEKSEKLSNNTFLLFIMQQLPFKIFPWKFQRADVCAHALLWSFQDFLF